MIRAAVVPALILVAAVACTHRVEVVLAPPYGLSSSARTEPSRRLSSVRPPIVFRPGTFADKRPDTTRLASWQHGFHTYRVVSKVAVSTFVLDGLGHVFRDAGHVWADSGTIRVDVEVLSIGAAMYAGFTTVGGASHMSIRLVFADVATNAVIYDGTYKGIFDEDFGIEAVVPVVKINRALENAIADCVQRVSVDTLLIAALQPKR